MMLSNEVNGSMKSGRGKDDAVKRGQCHHEIVVGARMMPSNEVHACKKEIPHAAG